MNQSIRKNARTHAHILDIEGSCEYVE